MAHPTLPLRRSRTLAALKTVQSDEMTKPQSKNQAEVDLLDDIRNFTKQRSSIEKDYAQSMLRLVGQFMQKRDANGYHGDVDSNRSAFAVWRTLLEESEKVYRARLVIAEQLMSQVSEMAKSQKQTKVQLFKKCHDLGNQLHGEMQQSIKEVTKAKKTYRELESVSAGARKSYHDAENSSILHWVGKRPVALILPRRQVASSIRVRRRPISNRIRLVERRAVFRYRRLRPPIPCSDRLLSAFLPTANRRQ
ncbi:F-BAR and double SH3 domains protein 2-like isoform X2 [Oscarella lobularis]|uniref:F-BAR and double SH3 domains protein 2-like isoform X2 n=1 Tax=Oscarella lobularis TaxID=121494 RepID=UPI0033136660